MAVSLTEKARAILMSVLDRLEKCIGWGGWVGVMLPATSLPFRVSKLA